jgi:hypothetical protein
MELTPEVERVVEEGVDGTKHRKSHQFRALSRRAATYHRRHWKLDLCCLGLCPAYRHARFRLTSRISVLIAGILGVVAEHFATGIGATNQTFLSNGIS